MTDTKSFLSEISQTMTDNILKFWLERMKDPLGGFYGQMKGDGTLVKDAPRGEILYARIIWSFSAAYRATGKREYLLTAMKTADYFLEKFVDHKHGGVYWSVDSDGKRLDTKKQLYAQAFAIYALSEYYKASADEEAIKWAKNIYRIVEKKFSDDVNGGYVEALARDFKPLDDMSLSAHDINADKTMNSHLHLLEAYANLYKVWPDATLGQKVAALLDIMTDRITDPSTGHLQLYFKADWTPIFEGWSYGHDIETSWLALEAAFILHDIDVINKVKPMSLKIAKAGLEGYREDGSMIYEIHKDGSVDDSRQWWVQAETVVGNLWLWKYHDDENGASRALATWEYIKTHLIDTKDGEWIWSCSSGGVPNREDDKAGFWKCPYHNTRMCLEVLSII